MIEQSLIRLLIEDFVREVLLDVFVFSNNNGDPHRVGPSERDGRLIQNLLTILSNDSLAMWILDLSLRISD